MAREVPAIARSCRSAWDRVAPFFALAERQTFSAAIRRAIHATNAIESLNSTVRAHGPLPQRPDRRPAGVLGAAQRRSEGLAFHQGTSSKLGLRWRWVDGRRRVARPPRGEAPRTGQRAAVGGAPASRRLLAGLASAPGAAEEASGDAWPQPERHRDAAVLLSLRCICGVAPVTRRSGKSLLVVRRLAAHDRLRDATYHWVRVAAQRDPVSKAKYKCCCQHGHRHARPPLGDRPAAERRVRDVARRCRLRSPARRSQVGLAAHIAFDSSDGCVFSAVPT